MVLAYFGLCRDIYALPGVARLALCTSPTPNHRKCWRQRRLAQTSDFSHQGRIQNDSVQKVWVGVAWNLGHLFLNLRFFFWKMFPKSHTSFGNFWPPAMHSQFSHDTGSPWPKALECCVNQEIFSSDVKTGLLIRTEAELPCYHVFGAICPWHSTTARTRMRTVAHLALTANWSSAA